jgi:hypothetical protein
MAVALYLRGMPEPMEYVGGVSQSALPASRTPARTTKESPTAGNCGVEVVANVAMTLIHAAAPASVEYSLDRDPIFRGRTGELQLA